MYQKLLPLFILLATWGCKQQTQDKTNIVLVVCDDLAYRDLSCYGQTNYQTPNLDKLAEEGTRFTDFYTAANVCSASRASYLTGLYPDKHGIPGVLFPNSKNMLDSSLITLPELMKQQGYTTGITGKWHLGDREGGMPWNHGFDAYFGIPYSNDMLGKRKNCPPLPLYKNKEVLETEPDQSQFTKRLTHFATKFIETNKNEAFFLMVTHIMPHVPIFASEAFKEKTGAGTYADVISEIDWSIGQIRATLEKNGLAENTVVIFTSDNGPWLSYGNHGGDPGPLREGKFTTFEGGHRVPFIVWGKHVKQVTENNTPVSAVDVYPTLAEIAGCTFSHNIDGVSLLSLFQGAANLKKDHPVFYYSNNKKQAVRLNQYKYHTPHKYKTVVSFGNNGKNGKSATAETDAALFDLSNDVGESENVLTEHKKEAEGLQQLLNQ